MCAYKLSFNGQNVAQKGLAQAKILLITFFLGGGVFFTQPYMIQPVVYKQL